MENNNLSEAKSVFKSLLKTDLDDSIRAESYYRLNEIYSRQNVIDSAIIYGNQALKYFIKTENYEKIGLMNYYLSMDNLVAGDYEIALLQTQQAYEAFETINDTLRMIRSLCRKGIVFHDIGEYDEGIAVLQEAKNLYDLRAKEDADLLAMIWGISAINYDDRGSSDKAVEIHRQILALRDKLSGDREIIRTYNNMGNSLMKLGELDEAEHYISLNLKANQEADFKYGIATATTNLGTIAYKKSEFNKSEELLTKAEYISFEIGDSEKIIDVLYQKSQLYEAWEKYDLALKYFKNYKNYKDSLYSLDKQRQLRFLEAKYNTGKKEQQIEIQNAQLAQKEAELKTTRTYLFLGGLVIVLLISLFFLNRNRIKKKQELALKLERINSREAELRAAINSQEKERKRYARDLHDGFGQLISILNLNLKKLSETKEKDDRYSVFQESEKVLNEMHQELKNICFDMMPQTLIQQGLVQALDEFAAKVNVSGEIHVLTDFFGLDKRLDDIQELALYRITQEWINNILKYSDAKKITLQVSADDKEISLLIEDDGMGFDKSVLIRGKGNGWKNIQSRGNLINGEVFLENQPGIKGNTLIVEAPIKIKSAEENTVKKV